MAENNTLSQLQNLLKNAKLNDIIKQAESVLGKDDNKSLTKVLKMLKSMQGGKLLGKLGKVAGLSSLMSKAETLQNSTENTEEQEVKLDELDTMVAVALEDGVITEEEEKLLSAKAAELNLNVEEFIAEIKAKCANA